MSEDRELKLIKEIDRLSEEHKMLQSTLETIIQPQMKDLIHQRQKADQIVQAVRKGHVKSPSYIPDVEDGYWPTVRKLVVRAVYSIYNEHGRPTKDRREVIPIVQDRIEEMIRLGRWPRNWKVPGKDTVIRRQNETADVRHYPEGVTPCICVSPGSYIPNPTMFDEPTRSELKSLARKWPKTRKP